MITDYATLQTTIAQWLQRETQQDFTDEVPTFIQLAEVEMWNGTQESIPLRCREMQLRFRALLNEEFEWLPGAGNDPGDSIFLEQQWCTLIYTDSGGTVTETSMTYKDLPEFLNDPGNDSQPTIYTIWGEQIRFRPDPTINPPAAPAQWEFELSCYGTFKPLSDADPVNDILSRYPQLYLKGSLLQAESYIANDARVALWRTQYIQGIEAANKTAESGRRGTVAIGPPQ